MLKQLQDQETEVCSPCKSLDLSFCTVALFCFVTRLGLQQPQDFSNAFGDQTTDLKCDDKSEILHNRHSWTVCRAVKRLIVDTGGLTAPLAEPYAHDVWRNLLWVCAVHLHKTPIHLFVTYTGMLRYCILVSVTYTICDILLNTLHSFCYSSQMLCYETAKDSFSKHSKKSYGGMFLISSFKSFIVKATGPNVLLAMRSGA